MGENKLHWLTFAQLDGSDFKFLSSVLPTFNRKHFHLVLDSAVTKLGSNCCELSLKFPGEEAKDKQEVAASLANKTSVNAATLGVGTAAKEFLGGRFYYTSDWLWQQFT